MRNRKNIILNYIKTLMSILYPVITFSYSSRILGVENIGKINFSRSIVFYFTMLAVLGTANYGMREGAKFCNKKEELNKLALEILLINTISTVVTYILFFITLFWSPKLHQYWALLLVNSLSIGLTSMGTEWLYNVLGEYKYLTIRTCLFQLTSLLLLFIFVKDSKDYVLYMGICVLATTGFYIVNILRLPRVIEFKKYTDYNIKKHSIPIMILFVQAASVQLYANLDTTLLGILCGDLAVGYYTAAVKIVRMINPVIISFGTVLLPQTTLLLEENNISQYRDMLKHIFKYLFLISIPSALGLFLLSGDLLLLFCGRGYELSIVPMKVLSFLVIIIPFGSLIQMHIFLPNGKERYMLYATLCGAVVNFALDMLFIPRFGTNGAAVATVVAELGVTSMCILLSKVYFSFYNVFFAIIQYVCACIPMLFVFIICKILFEKNLVCIIIEIILCIIVYFMMLLFEKNEFILQISVLILNKVKSKFRH